MRSIVIAMCLCGPAFADSSVAPPAKSARTEGGCEKLPAAWKLDAIAEAAAARDGGKTMPIARVLTWKIEEDDRPLRLESVLVWLQRDKHWTLANLYRHPQDGPSATWKVSMVYDVPYVGEESYDHAPTRGDLEKFLTDTWWHFAPRDGFKILDSEVCREAWRAAFAAPPWHAYSAK